MVLPDCYSRPKVVVIGAGFAGLACARELAGSEVYTVLVDRNNYHLFTPLLYQVASSLLGPGEIARPVRSLLRGTDNVHFLMAEVRGADPARRRVLFRDGLELPYDFLVVAAGSETHFFGLRGAEGWAHGLKDLPEALELRHHILRIFETAAHSTDAAERRALLTFVVVGGGPTGVEYAGALAELARLVLSKDFPEVPRGEIRILLLEGSGRVLSPFPEPLSRSAQRSLEGLGVEVRLDARVETATAETVRLTSGESIPARTVVWAAGVRASSLAAKLGLPLTKNGRIAVDEGLRVPGRENVYAVGDVAAALHDGRELPLLAPVAMQEGVHAARAVLRGLRGLPPAAFRYTDRGIMATIGRNSAVAAAGPLRLSGFPGWVAWLALHLYFIIGFRNRLLVLLGWAWGYFFYDRPIRIIAEAKRGEAAQ